MSRRCVMVGNRLECSAGVFFSKRVEKGIQFSRHGKAGHPNAVRMIKVWNKPNILITLETFSGSLKILKHLREMESALDDKGHLKMSNE
jgi:hypothetical protein